MEKSLITTGPEEGEKLAIAGSDYRIVLTGEQTGDKLAVIEMNIPPGSGPVPHEHPSFQESFYVLEGEVEFRTQSGTYTGRKGAMVTIPEGGPVHNFRNVSGEMARLLCIVAPAGLDAFFKEVSNTLGKEGKPQSPTDAEKAKLLETAGRYGQKLYPPDYFEKQE
ncbi:cupin domain-containing protein [Flavobacterium hauense]